MQKWRITVKGNIAFSITLLKEAVKIEDAVAAAVKDALLVTAETIVQVQACRS